MYVIVLMGIMTMNQQGIVLNVCIIIVIVESMKSVMNVQDLINL